MSMGVRCTQLLLGPLLGPTWSSCPAPGMGGAQVCTDHGGCQGFFDCTSRNPLPCRGQSLLERNVDEKGDSGALATCLRVMSRVQQQFYEQGARSRG